jgi:hypothetical protein
MELRKHVMDDEHNTDTDVQLGVLQASWMMDKLVGKEDKIDTDMSLVAPQRRFNDASVTYKGLLDAQDLILTRLVSLKTTKAEIEQLLKEV